MNRILKKSFTLSLTSGLIGILFGVLLFLEAEATLKTISYIIGGILFVVGVISDVKILTDKNAKEYLNTNFIIGVFSTIMGIILIFNPTILGSILPFVLGMWLVINGIMKFQIVTVLKGENSKAWIKMLVYSICILLLGIVIIINPFKGAILVTKTIGIILIVYCLIDIFTSFYIKKDIKTVEKEFKKLNEENIKIIDAKE